MKDKYSLWRLLKEGKIAIPIIQRDYAQGRKDKGYIRKIFLKDIKKYLDYDDESKIKELSLDFIYGTKKDGVFYPLDGQQRLTTLWLLHWYLAYKTGKLKDDDVKKTLKQFTYEVRTSSEEFFMALCEKTIEDNINNENEVNANNDKKTIAKLIKSQNWFYSSWLLDPTVSSALIMLSGLEENSYKDSIEEVFSKENTQKEYEYYWKQLVENERVNCYLMVIGSEKLPISDNLYIKMNARGKPLTSFENFKADLIDNMNQNIDFQNQTINASGESKGSYSMRIDTVWTDVFWNNLIRKNWDKLNKINNDSKQKANDFNNVRFDDIVDEGLYLFLNRYFLNKLLIEKENGQYLNVSSFDNENNDNGKEETKIFNKLYGTRLDKNNADDSKVVYEDFDYYKRFITVENIKEIDKIFEIISNENLWEKLKFNININFKNKSESYSFLPYFNEAYQINGAKQKERVYFFAICKFLINLKYPILESDEKDIDRINEEFKAWMRVVRNLTENAMIDNITNMVNCLRLVNDIFDGMKLNNIGVLEYLKSINVDKTGKDSSLYKQYFEEIEKAEPLTDNDEKIQQSIYEAENYSFFNGTIRFLYRDENNNPKWDDFENKFNIAKGLFSNGANDVVPYETNVKLLKLFKNFDQIRDKYYFTTKGNNNRNYSWKKDILCDKNKSKEVDDLLNGVVPNENDMDESYRAFVNSGLIKIICEREKSYNCCYKWKYGSNGIFERRKREPIIIVNEDRYTANKIIRELIEDNTIELTDSNTNKYCNGFYLGDSLSFKYKGLNFTWDMYGTVRSIRDEENDRFEWNIEQNKDNKKSFIDELDRICNK